MKTSNGPELRHTLLAEHHKVLSCSSVLPVQVFVGVDGFLLDTMGGALTINLSKIGMHNDVMASCL